VYASIVLVKSNPTDSQMKNEDNLFINTIITFDFMDWPIFYKDDLKIGSPNSSVGICTLWTKKEIIHNQIPESKYLVCGNLYTIQGINPLLKNILAKPNIRYIVLCGADLMKSGDALINFINSGIDEHRKIKGSSGYIDSNIPLELVEKLRSSVAILDMRGNEKNVLKKIEELQNKPQFTEPVFITELEATPSTLKSEEVAFRVNGKNISETWLKLLDVILKFGEEKQSDYKIKQKEILDIIAVVEDDDGKMAPWLNISEQDLKNYYEHFFSAEKPYGVEYTYGERLFRYTLSSVPEKFIGEVGQTKNQIEDVVKILKERPFTRRAVAFTLRETDPGSKNPPCLTQITFNVKNGKLIQTAIFRSHDIFGAWLLNVFALRKLQKEIAEKVGILPGDLVIISNSAHIYENSWREAQNIVDKHYKGNILPFIEDKNGYFLIRVNGEIIVEHFTKEGLPSGYVFRGENAQELYRRILNENLISLMDHAAYIGHELARAEIALRDGKKFTMDVA